jgi:hypothetical protein
MAVSSSFGEGGGPETHLQGDQRLAGEEATEYTRSLPSDSELASGRELERIAERAVALRLYGSHGSGAEM